MAAYVSTTLAGLIEMGREQILGRLEESHASDGFFQNLRGQTFAWRDSICLLKEEASKLIAKRPAAGGWPLLMEYPLYRLGSRIDVVILADSLVLVIELKIGESDFRAEDRRQVEEYALDLRDFHAESHDRTILPMLWCTEATAPYSSPDVPAGAVGAVLPVGKEGLATVLTELTTAGHGDALVAEQWESAPYRPVPSIIDAATSLFAGHGVRSITRADAANLEHASKRLVEIMQAARERRQRALIFLTGVPGSGKTLAGLHAVHDAVATGAEREGDIVYLSGNTPLVTVLREALTDDEYERGIAEGRDVKKGNIRRIVRARIQHINDFLRDALDQPDNEAPHEHAVVFDEAQRAWNARYGKQKFGRHDSEPAILLDLMGHHEDWCALTGLIGGGQEINSGEDGLAGWGDALRGLEGDRAQEWTLYAPAEILEGDASTGGMAIGELPSGLRIKTEEDLRLDVPMRSFRSPALSEWVHATLSGDVALAAELSGQLGAYPIVLTRSLDEARDWLRSQSRGLRRYGLVASSGARRLRAEGLGVMLNARDGTAIAHWYLRGHIDIRSSFALEVAANEYTCQGLEIDFAGVCWGGDYLRDAASSRWVCRRLSGARWQRVRKADSAS